MNDKDIISSILEILKDGKFHDLKKIAEFVGVQINFVKKFADFLVEFGLA